MAYTAIWKLALIGLGPKGEAIVNTFHCGTLGVESGAIGGVDVGTPWQGIMEATFPLLVTADWHEYLCQVVCIKGPNLGKSASLAATAFTPGTLGGPSAPLTVAAIGTRLSNGVGRHSRGRSFIGPLSAADVDVDGSFTPPGGWLVAWNGAAGIGPVVGAVQYDAILYDVAANDGTTVLSTSAATLIGTQRRRKLRLPN